MHLNIIRKIYDDWSFFTKVKTRSKKGLENRQKDKIPFLNVDESETRPSTD